MWKTNMIIFSNAEQKFKLVRNKMLDVRCAWSWKLPNDFKCSWERTISTKAWKKETVKTYAVFFFLLHVKTKLTLHFSAKASRITSTNFWKEKAMTPLYYIGSGYELFKNEGNGKDILKYAGAQNMSPAKLSWKIYLNIV